MVRRVPLFEDCDIQFLAQLMMQIKPQVLLQNDFAFREGDLGAAMFFIQFGQVEIGNMDMSVVYVTKNVGSFFGELSVVSSMPRTASAYAASDCILYYLTKGDFEEVAICFPAEFEKIYKKASTMLRAFRAKNAARVEKTCTRSASTGSSRRYSRRSSETPALIDMPDHMKLPEKKPSLLSRVSFSEVIRSSFGKRKPPGVVKHPPRPEPARQGQPAPAGHQC